MLHIVWMVFTLIDCKVLAFNEWNTPREGYEWSKNGTYYCYGEFCKQIDYRKSTPLDRNFTMSLNVIWSFGSNKSFADVYLKEIDVLEMVLRYEPVIVITWRDHRFRAKDSNPQNIRPLDVAVIKDIWIPDLLISNQLHSSIKTKNKQCDNKNFQGEII